MSLTTPSIDLLLTLDPIPGAVGTARRTLRDRGLSPDLDHTVELLTSEIVGNAVRHAPVDEQIILHAQITEDLVRVEVADHGEGFDPEVRHEAAGFGLRLVDKLASRWGVERTRRGCRVWFEVDRRSGRFARDA